MQFLYLTASSDWVHTRTRAHTQTSNVLYWCQLHYQNQRQDVVMLGPMQRLWTQYKKFMVVIETTES